MSSFEVLRCSEVRHTLGQHPALTRLGNGDLLLVYSDYTDRMEGQTGYLIRSKDNGANWSDPELVIAPRWWQGGTHATLGMQTLRSGRVLLPFDHGGNQKKDWKAPTRFICLHSDDNGRNWRGWDEQNLGSLRFSPYGKISELADGTVLCPGWAVRDSGKPMSMLLRSADAGQSWSVLAVICDTLPASETDVTLLPDGRLLATIRVAPEPSSTGLRLNWAYCAWSHDAGATWAAPQVSNVIGQNFATWLMADGTLIGACRGFDGTGRASADEIRADDVRFSDQKGFGIHLFTGHDGGKHWSYEMTLPDPAGRSYTAFHEAGEPCFCNLPNGEVMVAYYSFDASIADTWNQRYIPPFVQGEMKRIRHAFLRRICACVLRRR